MSGGKQSILDSIEMVLVADNGHEQKVYIDVFKNSLSCKWLSSLNQLLNENYHLEKNYCFVGFTESKRNAQFLCDRINASINAINVANLGYTIDDNFTIENTMLSLDYSEDREHEKLNWLHRYFEDLQGVSGAMSPFYNKADSTTRWHIRQLNLLCHEYESLLLSIRKDATAPMWKRPSQLMCWLNAPRFMLEESDYELFGVETLARPLGGVFVGVNKAVGKHHWEVFQDEGRDSRIGELVTSTLRAQSEAAGDFDIEWANNPGSYPWMQKSLAEFREWLTANNFNPDDKSLTIGHPQVGQVNLMRSFGTEDYAEIWKILGSHLDVRSIETNDAYCGFRYKWSDDNYMEQQIKLLK